MIRNISTGLRVVDTTGSETTGRHTHTHTARVTMKRELFNAVGRSTQKGFLIEILRATGGLACRTAAGDESSEHARQRPQVRVIAMARQGGSTNNYWPVISSVIV